MGYKDRDINTMNLSEDYMRSVSESELRDRAYTPFELDQHDRESIEEIKKYIALKKYTDKASIKDSLEYIEKLANKMNIAVQNEKKENKTTWELESDLNDLKKVFEKLNVVLKDIEAKEAEDATNKPNKNNRVYFRK